jgi:hypothetical protein
VKEKQQTDDFGTSYNYRVPFSPSKFSKERSICLFLKILLSSWLTQAKVLLLFQWKNAGKYKVLNIKCTLDGYKITEFTISMIFSGSR